MATQMTYDNTATGFAAGADKPTSLGARIRAWRARRQQISRVTFELNSYSDRELADLGLGRGDIEAVARGTFRRG